MILAAEVDPVVLGGLMTFGAAVVLGLFGWVLSTCVTLARQVAVNQEQISNHQEKISDHDQRITRLEYKFDE